MSDTNIQSEFTGAVDPPEAVDFTSLTDNGLVKAFEERVEESSEVWVPWLGPAGWSMGGLSDIPTAPFPSNSQ